MSLAIFVESLLIGERRRQIIKISSRIILDRSRDRAEGLYWKMFRGFYKGRAEGERGGGAEEGGVWITRRNAA
jgi:hypothetical protein